MPILLLFASAVAFHPFAVAPVELPEAVDDAPPTPVGALILPPLPARETPRRPVPPQRLLLADDAPVRLAALQGGLSPWNIGLSPLPPMQVDLGGNPPFQPWTPPGPVLPISSAIAGSSPSAVPEPATWAMLILGFGAVGAALRRVRRERALR